MRDGVLRPRPEPFMALTIEQHHDDKGIICPVPIAPYQVTSVLLYRDGIAVGETVEKYIRNWKRGVEVLFDDRTGITRYQVSTTLTCWASR